MKKQALAVSALILSTLVAGARAESQPAAPSAQAAHALEKIPAGKNEDLRVFYPDGRLVKGASALALMQAGKTSMNVWLAGNQFFAMQDVVTAFQKHFHEPVGVVTMPPGKVMNAVLAGGWTYDGKDYRMEPDVFGMVDMGSMKKLKNAGKGRDYVTYMHNELVLMVEKGNPKKIAGIADLGRSDLRIMLPNPVTEGIMKFYAKPVLQNNHLWEKLSQGKECQSCDGAPNVHFTSVHHREIPEGLKKGTIDVGIVWKTEYKNAIKNGAAVDVVTLPPKDSMRNEVSYFAGDVVGAPHPAAATKYLAFLGTAAGQKAYARHGFMKAAKAELQAKPIE